MARVVDPVGTATVVPTPATEAREAGAPEVTVPVGVAGMADPAARSRVEMTVPVGALAVMMRLTGGAGPA
jgi:hypothetical protein